MKACNVCENKKLLLVYESPDSLSVTTMNKLVSGKTSVYFCECCGHLQTNELENLKHYYAEEYEVNLASDDDDQLYGIIDGSPIYRAEHQANTLLKKINFSEGLRVLDYGCAKSQTLKKILMDYVDVKPFLFDVTDKYIPFWKTLPKAAEWSTHNPSLSWNGTMDVVLSFYALEHVADLHGAITNIKKLLKPGGVFYFLVPNVYENTADFIVADHVNHFSHSSLNRLLLLHGFVDVDIDATSHEAAFVVKAMLNRQQADVAILGINDAQVFKSKEAVLKMATYWTDIVTRIQGFESTISGEGVAIYGGGFYGNFIATAMQYPEKISCFVDQNRHLQKTKIRDKSVVSPENLPGDVKHVLVGMNPQRAKDNIAQIESWNTLNLNYFYL